MGARHEISTLLAAVRDELQAWQAAIDGLDVALDGVVMARADISRLAEALDAMEANAVLAVTASNAEARKAAVTLALADDASYQELAAQARDARQRLAEAERRVVVLKERCRLLRAGAALTVELDAGLP